MRSNNNAKTKRQSALESRCFEALESRCLLSGSNALDRLDFGNLSQEAAHNFEPGYSAAQMPILGVGTVGASAGQTYREPVGDGVDATSGSAALIFTMAVDPILQNYLTIRLWGSDTPGGAMYLVNASYSATNSPIDENGDPPSFPNRFYYLTVPIPIGWTQGHTSVQMTLSTYSDYDAYGGTGYHVLSQGQVDRPVYSVYTTTDPAFVPDSSDPTGTKPTQTGAVTLNPVTASQADSILLAERKSLYNSGQYFDQLLARQAIVLNSTQNADGTYGWSTPSGAPKEVAGLDMFTNLASWMSSHPGASADTWRSQIATQIPAPGYTAVPDELLSALTTTYLLSPLLNTSGNPVTGQGTLDHYHDPTLMARIVAALDGISYEQDSDGGFIQQGNTVSSSDAWTGLTSTARSSGSFTGSTARQTTVHGGGDLQGVDTQEIGLAIVNLLNDPTGAALLQTYLNQSYDANLNGGSVLRATAYERMLYNNIVFLTTHTGGTESQNLFQMSSLYASQIALEKLQTLFPNATYVFSETSALSYVKMVFGLIPDTLRGPGSTGSTNYGISASGLGEADGVLDGGYDGGYGLWLTYLLPQMATMGSLDPGIDSATLTSLQNIARASIDSYDQFISPQENATIVNGLVTADQWLLGPDDFITYRNIHNPNYNSTKLNTDTRYVAADPSGSIHDAYSLRSAYLNIEYGITPSTTADGHYEPRLNFLRDLPAYESTVKSLVNVDPATLTPLPGEVGQPDYTWADMQLGAVAFKNRGERVYLQMNWRNSYFDGGNYSTVGNVARIEDTTDTVLRAAQIIMPKDSADVQSDGNLTSSSYNGAWVVRYGDYLIVLNKSASTYSAKLPDGIGEAEDLVSKTYYALGTNVSVNVPAGQYAIFWLKANTVVGGLGLSLNSADIGSVGVTGSDSYANGVYTLNGAGAGIAGASDAFHFVSTTASGNVTIAAQITSQTAANGAAQAGIMIRDSSAADAPFAAVVRTPADGLMFEWRSVADGAVSWAAAPAPLSSAWVKLARSGDSFAGFYSTDGVTWLQIGTAQAVSVGTSAQVGLAVTSNSQAALSTATFGNVMLTAGVAPSVATPATAVLAANGKTANLSVLGADDGGEANLTYTWTLLSAPDAVMYSSNGTNAAKNITVTFAATGTYSFRLLIKDAGGAIASEDMIVNVPQILAGLNVTPNGAPNYVATAGTQQFAAVPLDQFGKAMSGNTLSLSWSLDAGSVGAISSTGLYTAPASGGGNATVRATSGSISGTSTITIIGQFTASQDIGGPALTGSVSYSSTNGGTYTVNGSGTDIWTGNDQFRYVYIPVTGDFTVTAHVASISNSDPALGFAKSGVMIRANLDPQSAYAFMSQTYSKGANFQWRTTESGGPGQSYTGSGTNSGWVRLVRSGNTFTAYYSADGVTWLQTAVSTQTVVMSATVYVGLAVTSRNASTINTTVFDNVTIQSNAVTPTFTYDVDIGSPSPAGTYSQTAGGTVTVTAGGTDIYSTSDQFNLAYVPITGNVTITAHVVSLTNTNTNAKAGVIIRNTLNASSAFIDAVVTATNGIDMDSRSAQGGGPSETKVSGSPGYWVQLQRSGNSFSAWYSSTGATGSYVQIGSSKTISMNSTVYVGLATTSHNNGTATTAVYDNISISGTLDVTPTVAVAAAANANPVTGSTIGLSVLGADSDGGGESNLTYTWSVRPYPASTPANVTFSANGTNAAKNTTATFTASGTYVLDVTITDNGGLHTTSSVTVTVNQTLSSISLSPLAPSVSPLGSLQFSAVALDQFSQPMAAQPTLTWSITSGSGSVNSSGLYSAPLTGTSATVKVASGSVNATTTVNIVNQAPLVASSFVPAVTGNAYVGGNTPLAILGVDDSGESNLRYVWSVVGTPPAPVTFSDNGNNAAKNTTATFTASGTYALQVAVVDPAGQQAVSQLNVVVSYLKGDLNLDGQRDAGDIQPLQTALTDPIAYLSTYHLSSQNFAYVADVNNDGYVSNADLQALLYQLRTGGASFSSENTLSTASSAAAPVTVVSSDEPNASPNTTVSSAASPASTADSISSQTSFVVPVSNVLYFGFPDGSSSPTIAETFPTTNAVSVDIGASAPIVGTAPERLPEIATIPGTTPSRAIFAVLATDSEQANDGVAAWETKWPDAGNQSERLMTPEYRFLLKNQNSSSQSQSWFEGGLVVVPSPHTDSLHRTAKHQRLSAIETVPDESILDEIFADLCDYATYM